MVPLGSMTTKRAFLCTSSSRKLAMMSGLRTTAAPNGRRDMLSIQLTSLSSGNGPGRSRAYMMMWLTSKRLKSSPASKKYFISAGLREISRCSMHSRTLRSPSSQITFTSSLPSPHALLTHRMDQSSTIRDPCTRTPQSEFTINMGRTGM